MRQIYSSALDLIIRRIKTCIKEIKTNEDADSLKYWQNQLALALHTKTYILNRLELTQNIIYVDFQTKKRVA